MYLNEVYLGNNLSWHGYRRAVLLPCACLQAYAPQGALLAALIRNPPATTRYNTPAGRSLRRNDVVNRMVRVGPGNGGITGPTRSEGEKQPLGLAKNVGEVHLPTPPFIVDYVKQQIHDDPNGWYSFLGATSDQRDKALAEAASASSRRSTRTGNAPRKRRRTSRWRRPRPTRNTADGGHGGLVSLDAQTGAIKTMLSGSTTSGATEAQMVTTVHQPDRRSNPTC